MPPGFEFAPMLPIEIALTVMFFGGTTMVSETLFWFVLYFGLVKADKGTDDPGCLFMILALICMFFGTATATWVVPNSWYSILGKETDISGYVNWTNSIIVLTPLLVVIAFAIIAYRQERPRRRGEGYVEKTA